MRLVRGRVFRIALALMVVLGLMAQPVTGVYLSGWSHTYAYGEEDGSGSEGSSPSTADEEKPAADLVISTADDLFDFAAAVNAGDDFLGSVVRLGTDIDLEGVEWTPIGSYAARRSFAGDFDGDGHAIRGLSISSGDGVALFGYLTGELMGLTVAGSVSGGEGVAGVVAYLAGTVRDVTNQATVFATDSQVGGIAADAVGTFLIADCANEGNVTNSSNIQSSGKLGGILGRADTWTGGVIERCRNTADITGYQYLAGIAGGVFGDVSVRTSYNTGAIEGKSFGKVYLGGIVGKLEAGTIDSCYNRGTVYGNRINQEMGHIRAIGGIVGCEENHTVGTAISNVYQAGSIRFNATGLDPLSDNHYVMMTGHISGGNSSTDTNTMTYEDCFYELGCYPQAEPGHPDSIFFRHEEGIALWDTPFVTAATSDELQGTATLMALGTAFEADTRGINDGYPVLVWQNNGADVPAPLYDVRQLVVLGGEAEVAVWPQQAIEGETVNIAATSVESGKRVYRVAVTDVSGSAIAVYAQDDGSYRFNMPGRSVNVELILENDVAGGGETNALIGPEGLDAIWTLWMESSGTRFDADGVADDAVSSAADGVSSVGYAATSTVFVHVQKNPDALSTTLLGISVTATGNASAEANLVEGAEVSVVALREGLFAFTMPACDVALSLEVSYASLAVAVQAGESGVAQTLRTYGRAEMEALAQNDVYYSGWASETDPMIGRADTAVALSTLLADAGASFTAGDTLRIGSIDGMTLSYSYEDLMGVPRYYYPGIFDGSVDACAPFEPILTIKQNVALRSAGAGTEPSTGDTLNAYRFIFGQSEADFTNQVKVIDRLMKYVTSVTVVKGSGPPRSGDLDGDGLATASDIVLAARALLGWDTLTEAQRLAADMDGDTLLTVTDVMDIARKSLGL